MGGAAPGGLHAGHQVSPRAQHAAEIEFDPERTADAGLAIGRADLPLVVQAGKVQALEIIEGVDLAVLA